MAQCNLCGRGPFDIQGYLSRVNPPGEEAIWQCRPFCGARLTSEDAIIAAIDGENDDWSWSPDETGMNEGDI